MRAASTTLTVGCSLLVLAVAGCGTEDAPESQAQGGTATGGVVATGGTGGGVEASGGATAGGATTGGAGTGGAVTGGATTGGATTGGAGTGGATTGGAPGGGSAAGGSNAIGGASGGTGTGGAAGSTASAGGSATGGSAAGGAGVGGVATGGTIEGGAPNGGAAGSTTSLGGGATGGSEGGAPGGGAATGGAATGGALAGCTPGRLDESASCQTPDFRTGAPGQAVDCVGELDGRYGSIYATIDGQQYFLQVNEWGSSATQTMAHGGDYFYRMIVQQADTGTMGTGAPTGYPSMFIGSNGGHTTTGSGLPVAIADLRAVPTTWIWTDNGALADPEGNIFNAAYDVWFNTSVSEATQYSPTGGFLMVWLYDPPYAEPIGGAPAVTGVTLDGVSGTWDIWIGLNGEIPCISYVRTEMTQSLSFDLMRFIEDAVTRPGGIDASWALTNVFTGFEIWDGAQNVETTAFCAFVE